MVAVVGMKVGEVPPFDEDFLERGFAKAHPDLHSPHVAKPDEGLVSLRTLEVNLAALAAQLFRWARAHADLKIIPAVERELIINALKETYGNQVQAAKLLGITRATLRKRIEKFGIKQELNVG